MEWTLTTCAAWSVVQCTYLKVSVSVCVWVGLLSVCWKQADATHLQSPSHQRNFNNRVIYDASMRYLEDLAEWTEQAVVQQTGAPGDSE